MRGPRHQPGAVLSARASLYGLNFEYSVVRVAMGIVESVSPELSRDRDFPGSPNGLAAVFEIHRGIFHLGGFLAQVIIDGFLQNIGPHANNLVGSRIDPGHALEEGRSAL